MSGLLSSFFPYKLCLITGQHQSRFLNPAFDDMLLLQCDSELLRNQKSPHFTSFASPTVLNIGGKVPLWCQTGHWYTFQVCDCTLRETIYPLSLDCPLSKQVAGTTKHQLEQEAKIEHFYIPKAVNTGLNFLFCWRSKDCCLWPHKLQDSSGWRKKLVNRRFESLDQQEVWVGRRGPLFVSTLITTAVGPWARPLRALTAAWVRHWDRPLLLVCRMGQMHRTNSEDPSSCFPWNSCEMINISSVTWFQVGIKLETRFWHCSRCVISYVIT